MELIAVKLRVHNELIFWIWIFDKLDHVPRLDMDFREAEAEAEAEAGITITRLGKFNLHLN